MQEIVFPPLTLSNVQPESQNTWDCSLLLEGGQRVPYGLQHKILLSIDSNPELQAKSETLYPPLHKNQANMFLRLPMA